MYCDGACGRPASSADCSQVQLVGRFVEEDARRRLHADGRLAADRAVGDAVEVAREDRVLAVVFLVLERHLGLDDLLLERVLVTAQVEVADELHRDRRAALQRGAVGYVLDGRAEDPGHVDAVVFVEALVLDRDRRVLEVFRDRAPADRRAQLIGLDEAQACAVGGEHLRGAAQDESDAACRARAPSRPRARRRRSSRAPRSRARR